MQGTKLESIQFREIWTVDSNSLKREREKERAIETGGLNPTM